MCVSRACRSLHFFPTAFVTSKDVDASEESNLLQFFYSCVSGNLIYVRLKSLSIFPFFPTAFVTAISRSLYFDSSSASLIDAFVSVGMHMSTTIPKKRLDLSRFDRLINILLVLSFLSLFYYYCYRYHIVYQCRNIPKFMND